jgi:membrane protease YdiL (CAAX protease family)
MERYEREEVKAGLGDQERRPAASCVGAALGYGGLARGCKRQMSRVEGLHIQKVHRKSIILASPILVVVLGYFSAQLFTDLMGQWAWIYVLPVYWGSMLTIIWVSGGKARLGLWFRKSQGSRWWLVLGVTLGLIAFPLLLLPNIHVLTSPPLVTAWFTFAVINSVCEEIYWRGFLLDETSHLPRAVGVGYSTLLFVAVHPFVLGVFSHTMSFHSGQPFALLPFILILIVISVAWSLLYLKTRSLRWPVLSHFLTDLGNLSIFVFMNMI